MTARRRPGLGADRAARAVVTAALCTGASAVAQAPRAPEPIAPEAHWAARLGLRVEQVDRAFPLIDRVVLVPDAATYVDELFKWSPRGRWPVLFEEDRLAPMFIRRFRPDEVVRRESVGEWPGSREARRSMLESLVVRAWGGDPARHDLETVFAGQQYVPPGVVIGVADDPAWTAAAALAAARGLPLRWLDEPFGTPNEELGRSAVARLRAQVETLVAATGFAYEALGDDIDTVTLCGAISGRARVELAPSARLSDPNIDYKRSFAVTDLVARHADGARWAFTGWIFGSEQRCAYMAMCSLFLPREDVWLYNTYPRGGVWSLYRIDEAAADLEDKGFRVTRRGAEQATVRAWRRLLPHGLTTDVLIMNSRGMPDHFDLFSGRADAAEVPVLGTPLALHLVHSWSMHRPADLDTVGGQWLERGAYACVGSVDEPFLAAFVTPSMLVERVGGFVPFLVAARQLDGRRRLPWKVATIGDPLMLCRPPAAGPKPRVARPAEYGRRLDDTVKRLLRGLRADPGGAAASESIRTLVLLGRDEMAAQVWTLVRDHAGAPDAARHAVGALFRLGHREAFLQAWALQDAPSDEARTMLWHVMGPIASSLRDPEQLALLERAIRPAHARRDLEQLAPRLALVFGKEHARSVIDRYVEGASAEEREPLETLRAKYE